MCLGFLMLPWQPSYTIYNPASFSQASSSQAAGLNNLLELQLSWLHWMVTHTGSYLWVLFSGALLGLLIRAIYSELLYSSFLSIYMGPVARQVDHQVIQSILCCASITTYICDFNTTQPHSANPHPAVGWTIENTG
jgi:hypothetical protein